MVIFHSYINLPEGHPCCAVSQTLKCPKIIGCNVNSSCHIHSHINLWTTASLTLWSLALEFKHPPETSRNQLFVGWVADIWNYVGRAFDEYYCDGIWWDYDPLIYTALPFSKVDPVIGNHWQNHFTFILVQTSCLVFLLNSPQHPLQ